MVLGGGADSRPFLAAAMYRTGLAGSVLVPRSRLAPAQEDGILPSEDELVRRVLEAQGVPSDAIIQLETPCASTRDEARELKEFLRGRSQSRVAVVTTDYHTRRARRVFRRELGTARSQITMLGAPTESFSDENWWRSAAGFVTYANEWCKTAYYWVRY